jgi:SAM-dependent methyltransferase
VTDDSLAREAVFHDRRFGSGSARRGSTGVFYRTCAASRKAYYARVERHAPGNRLLEFGCGPGNAVFRFAPLARSVTGIDISGAAIDTAADRARTLAQTNVTLAVGDAHATGFADASFDLVFGTGILHHLDLEAAYAEIARLLAAGGRAVFLEPLGHNPAINFFRRLTPSLRTIDEHPLLMADVRRASRHFETVEVSYFHCTSLASVALARTPLFERTVAALDRVDRTMFTLAPVLRRYAWIAVMEFGRPLRAAAR